MPWTVTEEEDAMPLTDLLRTGEASRLRRRGALRGGHRREESEELPVRRVRERGADERQDGQLYLELSCGVRTSHFETAPSTSSGPGPLPQPRSTSSNSDFVYASTGCGAVVNSAATPRQPGCRASHQVYTSLDISNPDVARLPSKYLDSEQRGVVELLANDDCDCRCDWEAIGCSMCGNALGFLFVPCHSRHSLDNSRAGANPTYVFFPSSVTVSPTYTFPTIDPALYRTMPPLLALSVSESDDMSIDSPTFSPRVQVAEAQPYQAGGEDVDGLAFAWFTEPHPAMAPTAPGSPVIPTPLAYSAQPVDYLRTAEELETPRRSEDRRSSAPPYPRPLETRAQATFGSPARLRTRHQDPTPPVPRANRDVPSDEDEWSVFLLGGDRGVSSARRHLEGRASTGSRNSLHPWVPRHQRERPPGAFERPSDRDHGDAITYRESPERRGAQSSVVPVPVPAPPTRTRSPEPPALHRMSRRSLGALAPPMRRPASFDASSWRQYLSRPPRPVHALEEQERPRDGGRDAPRPARWTTPALSARPAPSRRPGPAPVSPPAFTLVDPAGERSYPPSTRSSLDARDTLSVESEARMFGRHLDEDALAGDVVHDNSEARERWDGRYGLRTEEPEEEDEEKLDEE